MRSPSGVQKSGMRGRDPVDTNVASALNTSMPSTVVTSTSCALRNFAEPDSIRTRWLLSNLTMFWLSLPTMPSTRSFNAASSTSTDALSSPMPRMRRLNDIAPPVAIIVFDGMQSNRWAAPPIRSRSTRVTSAPRRAA
jgi:hypothetical protein